MCVDCGRSPLEERWSRRLPAFGGEGSCESVGPEFVEPVYVAGDRPDFRDPAVADMEHESGADGAAAGQSHRTRPVVSRITLVEFVKGRR